MNKLDKDYQNLLKDILKNGTQKQTRNGETTSVFGRQIRHNMQDGFPLLTTKKMAIKSIITELKWFLRGDTNIKYLVDNGCNIWNGDSFTNYIREHEKLGEGIPYNIKEFIEKIKTDDEFANKWGELGRIYGAQWREWIGFKQFEKYAETVYVDQIKNLINDLQANPDSRRLMVNAWNPADLPNSVLPPCHYGFQIWTRELSFDERCDYAIKAGWMTEFGRFDFPETHYMLDSAKTPKRAISLMWNQRSCDVPLGIPFNIASYGMLLSLLAEEVNMMPDQLIGNLGDCHIYSNQVEGVEEQLKRVPKPNLPTLKLTNTEVLNGEFEYEILDYSSHPTIKFPLSN